MDFSSSLSSVYVHQFGSTIAFLSHEIPDSSLESIDVIHASLSLAQKNSFEAGIETDSLHFLSVNSLCEEDTYSVFDDREVVHTLTDEQRAREKEEEKKRLKIWEDRWNEGNPYSGFAIATSLTGKFIGYLSIDPGAPDQLELGLHLPPRYWKNGIAFEAIHTLVKEFIPSAMVEKPLLKSHRVKTLVAHIREGVPYQKGAEMIEVLNRIGLQEVRSEGSNEEGDHRLEMAIDLL